MELLAKLGIDWRLLVAQAVNFGILLGVLTFFAYRPLLTLIDARRARIAKALEDARRIEQQTKEMEAVRQRQLRAIDQEIGAMLERAKGEAQRLHDDILAAAKREADALFLKGKRQLEEERARVFHDVQDALVRMIVQMTEKILEREFSPADQMRLLQGLEKQIPSLLR